MMTFLAPGGEVLRGVLAVCEDPGGLDDDLHSETTPGQGGRIAFAEDFEPGFVSVRRDSDDLVPLGAHGARQRTGDRIMFQQVAGWRGP